MLKPKQEVLNIVVSYAKENPKYYKKLISEAKETGFIDLQKLNFLLTGESTFIDLIGLDKPLLIMYNTLLKYSDDHPALGEVFDEYEIDSMVEKPIKLVSYEDIVSLAKYSELYNSKQKINYIYDQCRDDELTERAKGMIDLFVDKTTDLEYKLNKDFCEFNKDEIADCLGGLLYSSYTTNKSDLKRYTKWCVDNAIVVEEVLDEYKELTYDDTHNEKYYKSNYYKDFADLEENLNDIMNNIKESDKNISYIGYTTMLLSWIGFDFAEIKDLKYDDIDDINKCICKNKKQIEDINPYIFDLIKIGCDNLNESDDGYLFTKLADKEHISIDLLRGYLFKFNNEKSDRKMVFKKVRLSGIFSRFYEWEQVGNKVTTDDMYDLKQLTCIPNLTLNKAKILLETYGYWKQYMCE